MMQLTDDHNTILSTDDRALVLKQREPLGAPDRLASPEIMMVGLSPYGDSLFAPYASPLELFDDFYQRSGWVRMPVDKISEEAGRDGWVVRQTERAEANAKSRVNQLSDWLWEWGFSRLRCEWLVDLPLFANAFGFIVRDRMQRPIRIERLHPPNMKPIGTASTGLVGWRQKVGFQTQDIAIEDIIHIRGYNPGSKVIGLPKLTSVMLGVELDQAAQKFNRAFFFNGPNAGAVFILPEMPANMKGKRPDEFKNEVMQYIERRYSSPEQAHTPLALFGEWKVEKGAAYGNIDASFINARKLSRSEIFGVLGVPEAIFFAEAGRLGGSVQDEAHEQFRNTIEFWEDFLDAEFYRQFILGQLQWSDVETAAKKRQRRTSLNMARAAHLIAQMGIAKMDELRELLNLSLLGETDGGNEMVQLGGANDFERQVMDVMEQNKDDFLSDVLPTGPTNGSGQSYEHQD